MKKKVKSLIVIGLGLMMGIFINTSNCFASTQNAITQIPVTGKVIFNNNPISNEIKGDIQGSVLMSSPKTGDEGVLIYLIVLISVLVVLVLLNRLEREDFKYEKVKDNSIN